MANEFMDPIYNRSGTTWGGLDCQGANRSGGWRNPWFVLPTPHKGIGFGVVTFSKWPNFMAELNGGLDPNHLQVMG